MRLLLINGNTSETITERCVAAARAAAAPTTEIVGATARAGPRIIGTRTENALAVPEVIRAYAEHADAVDAVLVATSLDTGLDALREAAPCPVVGMTEAGLHVAALLGGPIGFVAPVGRVLNVYRELVDRVGLERRVIAFEVLEMAPEDFVEPGRAEARLRAGCAALVDKGAESVLVAGAAFAGIADSLAATLPVPLVDGIACGVVLAEALTRLRPTKATAGSHAWLPARELVAVAAEVEALFGRGPGRARPTSSTAARSRARARPSAGR
jgi:allantoin racemase